MVFNATFNNILVTCISVIWVSVLVIMMEENGVPEINRSSFFSVLTEMFGFI